MASGAVRHQRAIELQQVAGGAADTPETRTEMRDCAHRVGRMKICAGVMARTTYNSRVAATATGTAIDQRH